jgi:hypothetical protein
VELVVVYVCVGWVVYQVLLNSVFLNGHGQTRYTHTQQLHPQEKEQTDNSV